MRLGLLIYGSLDTVSGGYLYDRKLVETLRNHGDSVEILSIPWRNYPRHLADNLNADLVERMLRLDVDVLLQDELNHPSLFWSNRRLRARWGASRTRPYPLVSIVHHLRSSELRPAWQNHCYRWVERRYLETLDGFIYNSQTTCRVVKEVSPLAAGIPGVVAYPAGDRFCPDLAEADIVQRANQPGPLRLVFLGNLIPRKGLHVLLAALSSLTIGAFTLAVIGGQDVNPAYTRSVHRQVQAAGLDRFVSFLGYQDQACLAEHLQNAQVLVVPSSYEGFGIAYMEGMSFGLPALACKVGATTEIITHGQDGYLLPPEAPKPLATCLAELAADRASLARMSLAARQRYLSHPSWEQAGLTVRRFLEQEIVK